MSEFNLSDKRKELFGTWNRVSEGIPNSLIKSIEEQDKEFIRLLKEELTKLCGNRDLEYGEHHPFCESCIDTNNKIDKLAGDKLTSSSENQSEVKG